MSQRVRTQSWIDQTYWFEDTDVLSFPPYNETAYVGQITTQCDLTDYDGTLGMADSTVEALATAKKIKITPPNGTPAIALRFKSDGNANDDSIIQLYASAGIDHYQHMAQLTVVQGTQLYSGSIYFCDGVTPANEKWYSTVTELSGTANFIGSYVFNTHGYDRFLILCNDLDTTTLYVDWRIIP